MAVLFLLNALQIGGSEVKTVRVVNALRDREQPVYLGFLNFSSRQKNMVSDRVPLIDFRRKGKFDPGVLTRIGEFIRANRINSLFCINLYPSLYGTMVQALNRHQGVRCVAFINTTNFPHLSKELKMLIYRPALINASKLVFGCKNQQELWISRYRLPPERCMHLYNGVDLTHFAPPSLDREKITVRKRLGFSDEEIVIASVAQFRLGKKQEDLVAACTLLAEQGFPVRLALVGEGPERSRVQNFAEKSGMRNRIHFLGQLEDVRPILSACDIFALTSVAVETFSNAALEAMAMERPVVLSDIGGAAEMVEEGVNGFLFPPGDVAALAEKLALMARDSELRSQMSLQARRVVQERFSFETMLRGYENLIHFPWPQEGT
jgi:glycosyltransferase involved in cell wall biosynthesis